MGITDCPSGYEIVAQETKHIFEAGAIRHAPTDIKNVQSILNNPKLELTAQAGPADGMMGAGTGMALEELLIRAQIEQGVLPGEVSRDINDNTLANVADYMNNAGFDKEEISSLVGSLKSLDQAEPGQTSVLDQSYIRGQNDINAFHDGASCTVDMGWMKERVTPDEALVQNTLATNTEIELPQSKPAKNDNPDGLSTSKESILEQNTSTQEPPKEDHRQIMADKVMPSITEVAFGDKEDFNGDGTVSKDEFYLKEDMKALDLNGDGEITVSEVSQHIYDQENLVNSEGRTTSYAQELYGDDIQTVVQLAEHFEKAAQDVIAVKEPTFEQKPELGQDTNSPVYNTTEFKM